MGSGKGKQRRVQAATAQPVPDDLRDKRSSVSTEEERKRKWRIFAKKSGVAGVKITQYYLGRDVIPTVSDCNKMASELFNDAVQVGAVVLPDGYSVEDFEFYVRLSDGFPSLSRMLVKSLNLDIELPFPEYYLDNDNKMSSPNVAMYLDDLQYHIGGYLPMK